MELCSGAIESLIAKSFALQFQDLAIRLLI